MRVDLILGAQRKSLDRNRQCVAASCGRDLRGGRQARTQVLWRIAQSDHNLEILSLFAGRGLLRGGEPTGAHDGVIANLGDLAMENLLRNGIDRDICRLPQLHIHDVSFIHLDFSRDHGHVGDGHERAALRVLDTNDHGFAFTHG